KCRGNAVPSPTGCVGCWGDPRYLHQLCPDPSTGEGSCGRWYLSWNHLERDNGFDERAGMGMLEPQLTAEFPDAFPHSADPDANAARFKGRDILADATTIVPHLNDDLAVNNLQGHSGVACS